MKKSPYEDFLKNFRRTSLPDIATKFMDESYGMEQGMDGLDI